MRKHLQFRYLAKFAWATQRLRILVALGALLLVSLFLVPFRKTMWDWLEPAATVATLAVAILVWYGELKQDFLNQLPKRLTVSFWFELDGRPVEVMTCQRAPLVSEGDIRNWGLQLGGQMAGEIGRLEISPDLRIEGPEEVWDEGSPFREYKLRFTLTKLPTHLQEKQNQGENPPYIKWDLSKKTLLPQDSAIRPGPASR